MAPGCSWSGSRAPCDPGSCRWRLPQEREGQSSLHGLCSELVAVDLAGLCAGLPLGQAGMGVALQPRGFLVTWEVGGGGGKESFIFLTAWSQGLGTIGIDFPSVCV